MVTRYFEWRRCLRRRGSNDAGARTGRAARFFRATAASSDRTVNTMRKTNQNQRHDAMNAKISQLRELLISAKDLAEVCDYFHTVLVPDDVFMRCGVCSSEPRLFDALRAVLERVAPGGKLGAPMLARLQPQALCHGYTTWGRGHVVFFYFEQLDLGFCSYSASLFSETVTYLRFNLTNVACLGSWGIAKGQ